MKLTIALFGAALLAASLTANAGETASYGKRVTSIDAVAKSHTGSFDVFIDKPTGFAFVNTPSGWKFTRKVSGEALPANGQAVASAY